MGLGFAAVVIAALVILYAPPAPVPDDGTIPTTSTAPGHTITLDELEAMLTDAPEGPPPSFQVDTPDGPVTVVVPPTVPTTTTTTSTTTTTVPVVNRPPATVVTDIIGDLLGEQAPPTTSPEGADGEP